MSLSRSTAAFADRDGRADIGRANIADGVHDTAALKGSLSATLVHKKIAANAATSQYLTGRGIVIRRLSTNVVVLAKSIIYLALYVLVAAIALIYKYLFLILIYAIGQHSPAEFDRNAVIDALKEVGKDSKHGKFR